MAVIEKTKLIDEVSSETRKRKIIEKETTLFCTFSISWRWMIILKYCICISKSYVIVCHMFVYLLFSEFIPDTTKRTHYGEYF